MLEGVIWKALKCRYLECDYLIHNVDYLERTIPIHFKELNDLQQR